MAAEQGGAVLLVVKGPGFAKALATIETPFDRGPYNGGLTASIGSAGVGGLESLAPQAVATPEEQRLHALPFEDHQRVRMALPYARQGKGREIALEQFAVSPEVDGGGRRSSCSLDRRPEQTAASRPLTCSIGVASGVSLGSLEELMRLADRALYEAKGADRDRVTGEPPAG